ncbi:MAG TPA: hypothetical protein ENI23_04775 [bacterium]|nr:hypothetical protein [bacterium]
MKNKVYKLFGIKIFEIVVYEKGEQPLPKKLFGKAKGEVLEYTPEQEQRDRDKETIKKMEGK